MQILSTLLLVSALAVGFVDASPTRTVQNLARHGGDDKTPTKTTKDSCGSNEFFWEKRSCCLQKGGPKATPTPPSGIDCPFSWYFHHSQGACVPRNKPTNTATPTCGKSGWSWFPSLQCCSKGDHPTPPTSVPSSKPKPGGGHGGKDNDHGGKDKKDNKDRSDYKDKKDGRGGHDEHGWHKVKRNFEQWDASFCPTGLTTCPIAVHGVLTGDSECVDTLSDLTSCGGCVSLGQGTDCSTIPGASCMGGVCAVDA